MITREEIDEAVKRLKAEQEQAKLKIETWPQFFLVTVLGTIMVVIIMLVSPLSTAWEAYWGAKIWNDLIVPRTGWKQLSVGIIYLVAFFWHIFAYKPAPKKDEPKTKIRLWLLLLAFSPPFSYLCAWLAARWFF